MNRRLAAGLLAAASTLAIATTAAAEPIPPAKDGDQAKLAKAITVEGILRHERAFNRIAKSNGNNRAASTPGYEASVAYVRDQLKAEGYQVKVVPFDYVVFTETGTPELERTAPSPETYEAGVDFLTMTYSDAGEVAGRVVPTTDVQIPPGATPGSTSGCELSDFPTPPAGDPIALIQRGTCSFEIKAQNAAAAGYAGAIIFNEGQAGRTELLNGTLGNPVPIPVVGTTFALGEELVQLARVGQVTARLKVEATNEPGKSKNVIADTVGGRANRVVLVGSHLDSVPEGPGVNDNGSGTSTILEVALQLRKLNLKTRNKVRFAFWGAEEFGLKGSAAYVAGLTAEQAARIDLNLNFDMLGSPNYVRFVYDGDGSDTPAPGPAGSDEIEEAFLDYFGARKLETAPTAFDGRSDYGSFTAVGIPAGGLFSGAEGIKTPEQRRIFGGKAGVAYDPCYHQACDDISNLNKKALTEHGDAVGHVVLQFANRQEPVGAAAARAADARTAAADYLYQGPRLRK